MARFKVIAGKHVTGSQKSGTRKTYGKDQVFETSSDAETAFCDKYPDKFERIGSSAGIPPSARESANIEKGILHGPEDNRSPREAKTNEEVKTRESARVQEPPPDEIEVSVDMNKLEKMDAKQLTEFATKYDIPLKGAKKKEEILKIIKDTIEPDVK